MIDSNNILLVEDSDGDALLARIEIEKMGYDLNLVDHAKSLRHARTFMSVKNYGVIFLDYNLPDGAGTELLDEIDKNRTNVILLSGTPNIDEIKERFADKIQTASEKPLRQEKIEAQIEEWKIEKRVEKEKGKMCRAFWGLATAFFSLILGLLTHFSDGILIGIKAIITYYISSGAFDI